MSTLTALLTFLAVTSASIINQFSNGQRLTGTNFGIPCKNATYDYVVVGGGLAGSVVASRLTEYSNATVALIEAGSFAELSNGNWSQIPYFSEQWVGPDQDDWQPLIDWGLFTEPQINGKIIHYAQGKSLGGSSTRNQMMYHRATEGSYQAWADQVGDQNYTWENMEPFFKRSMQFSLNPRRPSNDTIYDASAYSSSGGPLHVSYPAFVYPLSAYAGPAFENIGLKQLPGFSSGELDGYGFWPFTIDPSTGLRSSAEASFLNQSMTRDTLTTYINSQARNIVFDNNTATGVNITINGVRPFTISARREVIVSAGAYHSPQLLMISGIGPKETLDKYNIPVISDLPGVGQNMWDSVNIGGPSYEVSLDGFSSFQQPELMEEATQQFLMNATGGLTNIGLDIGAWDIWPESVRQNLSSEAQQALSKFPSDWPIMEYSMTSSNRILTAASSVKQYGRIGCLMVAATSRGNMTIRSNSNLDTPIINPNWLRDPIDQEVAVMAYRRARQAWLGVPEGIRIGEESFPGRNVTTDADLLKSILETISTIHHASSSCAMGRKNDTMAVVDSHAKVFGVKNVRVIDSSSFPFTPPGHTQGTTYAHAEKLVNDVLTDYLGHSTI